MQGIIDADTHISEGEAMWAMMDPANHPRRPLMLSVPEDTVFGNRNAFWVIDGEIYPKAGGKGSFALVTPSAQKVQVGRKDSTPATREMTDINARLADMDKLNTAVQVVYPTLFLVYNTKDRELEVALCRAYNRFLAHACAQAPERIKWLAVLPFQSLKEAIDEIRFAKQNGAVGIFFRGIEGEYTLDHPYLFPVYEEAQKQNLSICVHTGCGVRAVLEMFDLSRNHTFGHTRVMPLLAFRDLVANKIPERFPACVSALSKPRPVGCRSCSISCAACRRISFPLARMLSCFASTGSSLPAKPTRIFLIWPSAWAKIIF